MKAKLVCTILFVLFVFFNAVFAIDSEDVDEGLEPAMGVRSLLHRYLMDGQASFKPRDVPEFDETYRKFQNECLEIHNVLRARHCVPPLVLDEEINIRAQLYANKLAMEDAPRLEHSTDRRGLFGENLYSVTRKTPIKSINPEKIVMAWYAEIDVYDYNNPVYSKSTGHFTQIVWKDTKRMGIAYAAGREGRKVFVVAQYGPPGNYGFAYRANVLPLSC